MKKEHKPNRTPIRIIKAYLFGMMSGMLLLEYIRNKKRPYLPCSECSDKTAKQADAEKNTLENDKEESK